MKPLHSITAILLSLALLTSCGKPADPLTFTGGYKIVSKTTVPAFAQDVVVKDNYAYVVQGQGGLAIINIENKDKPEFITYITEDVRGYSTKIDINKDSLVYIAAGTFGLTIININDAKNPIVENHNISIKPAKNVYLFNNYIFTPISERGVKISDISNPTIPGTTIEVSTNGFAQDAIVSNDSTKLFIACGEVGLSIYSIAFFQTGCAVSPVLSTTYLSGYAESVVLCNEKKLAYVACGTKGLQIIDYSDIADVKIIGSYNTYGYAKELLYENNKIYITSEKRGLQIIDVTNAKKPVLLGIVQTEYALGIDSDEKYIYVADEYEGLIVVAKK